MRLGAFWSFVIRQRMRHLGDFSVGFAASFAIIAYAVEILGTQGVGCIAVLGVYCNRFPQGFLLNLLFHVPSDSPWALPLMLLWWGILSVPQGIFAMALHDAWRYRRRPSDGPIPS